MHVMSTDLHLPISETGFHSKSRKSSREVRAYLVQIIIIIATYFLAGKLGQATENIRSSNLGPVWPAYGVALAAILICGYRAWVGVAAGAFLVAFSSPVPLLTALGQAAGATLAATIGGFLLNVADFRSSLTRLRDALAFMALGGLGSAVVSASVGVSVLYLTHLHAYSGLGSAWLIYWLGDGTGALLVTPLILTFPNLLKIHDRDRITELAVLLVFLTGTAFCIFGDLNLIPVGLHVFAFAVLPFVIWAAIHFGTGGATLAVLVIATIASVETASGYGPFAQSTPFTNAVLLDVFFAVLAVTGMIVAAVIAEREYAERQREQLVRQQGAMEARLAAEQALRASEERLRLAAQLGKMYAYEWDVAADTVVRSPEHVNILGLKAEPTSLGRQQILDRVHPDDRVKFMASASDLTPEHPTSQITYRLLRPDGSIIWLQKNARAFFDGQGKVVRTIGMVADVTERKLAEEALSNVSRRLIQAQEQERTRIARDLHDDVAQQLALLAIEIQQLPDNGRSPTELRIRADELHSRVVEISASAQTMSHQLHSSKLEYLGIVAAMRSLCKELGEQQKVEIDFASHDLPSPLPLEISLCLFRVLQEALHNAVKHSGVGHFEVRLWGTADEIHLMVSDLGVGFDTESAMIGSGLGLTSMQERLRLVNGEFSINSRLQHGTTLHARVPISTVNNSARAAG
jgi:PAS domain S-box-containing protein